MAKGLPRQADVLPGKLKAIKLMKRAGSESGRLTTRQKLILSGLYLSKYDALGLKKLGFESFIEAFNVIGYGLGSRPASIKNYRDEFDPLFSNPRMGWHKRPTREYRRAVFEEFNGLDFESFTGLIKSFFGYDDNLLSETLPVEQPQEGASSFAQRLMPLALRRNNILSLFNLTFPSSEATISRIRLAMAVATTFVCEQKLITRAFLP